MHETGEFRSPHYPWGGNIAFRRNVLESVGMFPTDLGRMGSGLLSNEEISVCKRIEQSGKIIRFAPNAVIHHKIQAGRLTKQSFYHRTYYQGRSDAILDQYSTSRYDRVRAFASFLFWSQLQPADSFDRKCRERLFIGYLSQLFGTPADVAKASEHRRLRALKTFLMKILKTSADVVSERERQFRQTEALVHERDRWLADRDKRIAALEEQYKILETDRDNWKRAAGERLEALDRQVALVQQLGDSYKLLETDRDNWQRLAQRQATTIATLQRKAWIRIGLRLRLLQRFDRE